MTGTPLVRTRRDGTVLIVSIERPEVRNAVDGPTAGALARAFQAFEEDDDLRVAVLTGSGGSFCSGADLGAVAEGAGPRGHRLEPPGIDDEMDPLAGDAPMGPTRMVLTKPVIAAIEGAAVAGGLELAIWCDLRVAAEDAFLGVYCRRWGVPLIDGGSVRLPRLIGQGRALDLILTGRRVGAQEAQGMGLIDRVVAPGEALEQALQLARGLAELPQEALRHDRLSAIEQWDLPFDYAMANEFDHGLEVLETGEAQAGAGEFLARGEEEA